jgi:hypothetical protein
MNILDQKIKTTLLALAEEIDIPNFDLNVNKNLIRIQPRRHILLRRYSVIGLCVVLLLSAVSVFAKDDLLKIITEFTSSKGGGNLVGYTFIGGKSSAAFEGQVIANLNTSDYNNNELQKLIGINFPKLRFNNLLLKNVYVELYDGGHFLISSHGEMPKNQSITLSIYHNLTKEMRIDAITNKSPENNLIDIHGKKASYIKASGISLLTWQRDQWTIVLSGSDIPEDSLLKIADDVDHQASNPAS